MTTWRLIQSGALSGAMNMALDEALYESVAQGVSPPVLRLYRWSPATVTLGYAQRHKDAVNLHVCRDHNIDVVRRSTGGRAVLHQHEVTYALIAPVNEQLFAGGILESYRAIAQPLQAMLTGFGIAAELTPARHGSQGAPHDICFTAPASYELSVNGQKIAGSAQKRNDRAFLQHGSIPLELDLMLMAKLFGAEGDETQARVCRQLEHKIGWVNRYLPQPITLDQFEAAMVEAFHASFAVEWQASAPEKLELERAAQLLEERFKCDPYLVEGHRH